MAIGNRNGIADPSPDCSFDSLQSILKCFNGTSSQSATDDAHKVATAIGASAVSLGAQLLLFVILRLRLTRIYQPRSYLVPERERVPQPPKGIIGWLYPLFTTTNQSLIQKCGLDAYFFLRFLRMLLKVFFPAAILVLPILLPINHTGGGGQKSLNSYSISNISSGDTNRLWAHCILAIIFIAWFCYVVFKELRGYIRVRQAFLTSPQHRIRASATTVLITGIPRKWLTLEALSGLYDVFPGGIKNIWINRNFDELADKVDRRDNIARDLEDAETGLIQLCRKKHAKAEKKRAKVDGKTMTKAERKQDQANEDAAAEKLAQGQGVSAGEHEETQHGDQDILDEEEERREIALHSPLAVMGQGLNAVGHGLGTLGKGIGVFGEKVVGGVDSGIHKASGDLNRVTERANAGGVAGGFVADESLYVNTTDSTAAPSPPAKPSLAAGLPARTVSSGLLKASQMDTSPRQPNHPYEIRPDSLGDSPTSNGTLGVPGINTTRPSADSKPQSDFHIELPASHQGKRRLWDIFNNADNSIAVPSPQPHVHEEDEYPLTHGKGANVATEAICSKSKWTEKLAFWKKNEDKDKDQVDYPCAINSELDQDQDEKACWRKYIEPEDRETMRLPLFCPTWFPALPFVGDKVDRIYHLRRELARLNLEIEADQDDVEKYALMNSAFVQFNHQVAAHMCCQTLSHHIPRQMSHRMVEISPDDVIWDNMAVKWWEQYLRTGIVLLISVGLLILFFIPVAFTSLLSNINQLAQAVPWLEWLKNSGPVARSIVTGILPPILLSLILLIVPIIFRLLVKQQGVPTGNAKELGVQQWFFTFLFIQVFLVVTVASGLVDFLTSGTYDPESIASTLALNLPSASNYFFTYLSVQGLSNSASALVQVMTLVGWFIFAPLFDSTPRAKWRRQTNLNNIQWGSFFPVFTNFAAIGLIYSIISPLILVFMIFIFGLFWVVYRYNVLYVFQFRNDTGGLLFPAAINQLFTGIYFLEACLIGFFFTLLKADNDNSDDVGGLPQAIIMIIVLLGTIIYQWLLNRAFKPLFQYLPITLEDEAVIRDEAFERAQASKFAPLSASETEEDRDIQHVLEHHERDEEDANNAVKDTDKRNVVEHRRSHASQPGNSPDLSRRAMSPEVEQRRWHDRKDDKQIFDTQKFKKVGPEAVAALRFLADGKRSARPDRQKNDPESQQTVGDILFSGFADELEDLTSEERDLLVRYSFQHTALRARRPVVWIPRDALGVSDDEIKRSKMMSTVEIEDANGRKEQRTNIWMSNEGTALDHKGRVVFRRSPPDFSNVDLILL